MLVVVLGQWSIALYSASTFGVGDELDYHAGRIGPAAEVLPCAERTYPRIRKKVKLEYYCTYEVPMMLLERAIQLVF